MKASVYSIHYEKLRVWLKTAREEQNLTLRDISAITGQHHSIYGKIEQGRRRIDIIEFVEYCNVLNIDPKDGLALILSSMANTKLV